MILGNIEGRSCFWTECHQLLISYWMYEIPSTDTWYAHHWTHHLVKSTPTPRSWIGNMVQPHHVGHPMLLGRATCLADFPKHTGSLREVEVTPIQQGRLIRTGSEPCHHCGPSIPKPWQFFDNSCSMSMYLRSRLHDSTASFSLHVYGPGDVDIQTSSSVINCSIL